MSEFYDLLDEYMGDEDALTDIRVVVRRCWFYDFIGAPTRMWQGQGKLFTSDGSEWLGTVDANGNDIHKTPSLQDGRDGTSANYKFSMPIIDLPGEPAMELYDQLKSEQWRVNNRNIICYLVLFKEGEALRPTTPIVFFKELLMLTPLFSEKIDTDANGTFVKKYMASINAKDNNFGRSNVPGGTYADAIQKERAKQQGVALDRGSEFLGLLANRTYQIP